MVLKGFEVLSGSEIERIFDVACKVLSEIGFFVESKSALTFLSSCGLEVDTGKQFAYVSRDQVESAVSSAPKNISLYSRSGEKRADLHNNNLYSVSGQTANYIIDINTGKRREGVLKDVADFSRLSDSLENIDSVTQAVVPRDVPGSATTVCTFKEMITNSSKPLGLNLYNGKSCRAVIEMAKITLKGSSLKDKPFLYTETSPTSPLSWEKGALEVLIESAKECVPCVSMPVPLAGMTAPVSLMGYLTQHLAETLSGLVIAQIVKKGCPVILGFISLGFDMRESVAGIANPETILCRTATGQIGRAIGIPTFTNGLDSDSHCLDEQMAWEKTLTTIALLNSGSNFCCNAGLFSAGLTISHEQLVVDDEIFGICKHLMKGIQVTESDLSFDLIAKVGPGKHYLEERQTLFDLKKEYYLNRLSKTMSYDRWKAKKGKTFSEVAHDKALELLGSHKPEPLPDGVASKLSEFVDEFAGVPEWG